MAARKARSIANEQVQTLPVVAKVEHAVLGREKLLGPGVNMERTQPRVCTAAPEHGEHTDQILSELGYSGEDIARFHHEGIA